MRTNTGIKSGIDKDIMKDLKKGDVLYSAVYDNGCGRTCEGSRIDEDEPR